MFIFYFRKIIFTAYAMMLSLKQNLSKVKELIFDIDKRF